jgi:hypothetical protein
MKATDNQSKPALMKGKLVLINALLIMLIVTVFAFTCMDLVKAIWLGWDGAYLPLVAFFISFEAIFSSTRTRNMNSFSKERSLYHLFEWITILLLLRLYLYILRGPSQILQDILLLDDSFFKTFFTSEYVLLLVFAIIFWLITITLNEPSHQLEEDDELMDQEKMGFTFNDRSEARKHLISAVFILGAIQLFTTALISSNIEVISDVVQNPRRFVFLLVLYFLLSFILLAVNQYSLQKARWYLSDMSVSEDVPRSWVSYAILFLAVITIIIIFLPTRYILGFFPAIKTLGTLLVYLYNLIQILIFLPFMLLAKLFGKENENNEPIENIEETPFSELLQEETSMLNSAGSPTWILIRSLIFWIIFILIAFFSIRFYIQQRKGLTRNLHNFPIKLWLKSLLKGIKDFFIRLFSLSQKGIAATITGVQTLLKKKPVNRLSDLTELIRGLSPRQTIVHHYIDLSQWLGKVNYIRRSSQTPYEYAKYLVVQLPTLADQIQLITRIFISARYTRQTINKKDRSDFEDAVELIKVTITSQNDQKNTEI